MESLALVFQKFTQGIVDIGKSILTFMNNVKTWFLDVTKTIVDRFTELGAWFWELPGRIWDSFKSGLELLFIPQGEITVVEELKELIKSKFPFIEQAKTMISTFINYSGASSIQDFSVTAYGHTFSIIDVSLFDPYIGKIHSIIIFLAWFGFVRRLYSKIPIIIAGVGGSIDTSSNDKNNKNGG